MSPIVVEGSGTGTGTGTLGLTLDGLDFISGSWLVDAVNWSPPRKRYEWAQAADLDGSYLVRDPLSENRELTLRMRTVEQATMSVALQLLSELVAKLEECEKEPDGLPLVLTPDDVDPSTLYVLSGEIEDLPLSYEGADAGWFQRSPVVTVKLVCKPFAYGAEVSVSAVSSSGPLATLTISNVKGDVPAEGRLLVTEASSKDRRFIEWGLEQRHYSAATSLLINSTGLSTTGFSGVGTTRSGAYNTDVIRATLVRHAMTAMAGTGNQNHTGTFRVKARLYVNSASYFRFTWQQGDGPFVSNPIVTPPVPSGWTEVDLGLISVNPGQLGTQRWTGRIEGMADPNNLVVNTTEADIDYLILMPAGEGYGKARAPNATTSGALVGSDQFTGTTAGGSLNTRTALVGGSWTDSAGGTGFAFADGPASGNETLVRSTTSDSAVRVASLGSTNYTAIEVSAGVYVSAAVGSAVRLGVVGRYVDANNYLVAYLVVDNPITRASTLVLAKLVGGSLTTLNSVGVTATEDTWYTVWLQAFASGQATAKLYGATYVVTGQAQEMVSVSAQDAVLATGGALATGKPGLYDYNSGGSVVSRYYDDFSVKGSPPESVALYSGRQLEFRHDGSVRQDSTGTYWGPVPAYRGGRFLVPPAGDGNRTSRIAVKAHRNDVESAADEPLGDSIQVSAFYTPRYITPPGI